MFLTVNTVFCILPPSRRRKGRERDPQMLAQSIEKGVTYFQNTDAGPSLGSNKGVGRMHVNS